MNGLGCFGFVLAVIVAAFLIVTDEEGPDDA